MRTQQSSGVTRIRSYSKYMFCIVVVTLAFTQPTYSFPAHSEAVTLTVLRQGNNLTQTTSAQCVADLAAQSVIAGDTVRSLHFPPQQEKQVHLFSSS